VKREKQVQAVPPCTRHAEVSNQAPPEQVHNAETFAKQVFVLPSSRRHKCRIERRLPAMPQKYTACARASMSGVRARTDGSAREPRVHDGGAKSGKRPTVSANPAHAEPQPPQSAARCRGTACRR